MINSLFFLKNKLLESSRTNYFLVIGILVPLFFFFFFSNFVKADTLTFYPDPDPENTSFDGFYHQSDGGGKSFLVFRDRTSANYVYDNFTYLDVGWDDHSAPNSIRELARAGMTFDTSLIPDDAVIDSVTLSLYGLLKADPKNNNLSFNVYSFNPVSDNFASYADYGAIGFVPYSSDITYNNFSVSGYNDFVLNSQGISAINKTGITKFGLKTNYDVNGVSPVIGTTLYEFNGFRIRSSEQSGLTYDPKLVVTYNAPPVAPIVSVPTESQYISDPTNLVASGTCEVNQDWTYLSYKWKDSDDTILSNGTTVCGGGGTWDTSYVYPSGPANANPISAGIKKFEIKQCEDSDISNCTVYSSLRTFQVGPDVPVIANPQDEDQYSLGTYRINVSGTCDYMSGWNTIEITNYATSTDFIIDKKTSYCAPGNTWFLETLNLAYLPISVQTGWQTLVVKSKYSDDYLTASSTLVDIFVYGVSYSTSTSPTSTDYGFADQDFGWFGGMFRDLFYWLFVPNSGQIQSIKNIFVNLSIIFKNTPPFGYLFDLKDDILTIDKGTRADRDIDILGASFDLYTIVDTTYNSAPFFSDFKDLLDWVMYLFLVLYMWSRLTDFELL